MTVAKRLRKRIQIDDGTAAVVNQIRTRLHQAQFGFSDHPGSGRRLRNVQTDDVALRQKILTALDGLGVTMTKLVGAGEENALRDNRCGTHRELRSYVAIAYNSERTSSLLAAACRGFIPSSFVGRRRAWKYASKQHDDFADHQLSYAARVGAW